MRVLPRLFGLLLLALLASLLLLGSTGCGAARPSTDRPDPTRDLSSRSSDGTALGGAASSRQIMQLGEAGKIDYRTARSVIAASLSRQLNDGSVIDRVIVRQVPLDDPKSQAKPPYYLIGIGLNQGHYRAIALPLRGTDDGTYYLTPYADRYIITGTGCPNCFFDFEDGHIIGTSCDDGSGGGDCKLQILSANQVFVSK